MMLDSGVLAAPLLDHRELDLDAAGSVTYILRQSFRYDYDAPVESLRQRLVIVPPARHGGQHRRAHLLEVSGARAQRRLGRDTYGNVVAWLRADRVADAVEFRLTALVWPAKAHPAHGRGRPPARPVRRPDRQRGYAAGECRADL